MYIYTTKLSKSTACLTNILAINISVNWSKARYLMLQGQMDHAMIHLERV